MCLFTFCARFLTCTVELLRVDSITASLGLTGLGFAAGEHWVAKDKNKSRSNASNKVMAERERRERQIDQD